MNDPTHAPSAPVTPAGAPLWLRSLRFFARLVLVLGLSIISLVTLVGCVPAASAAVEQWFSLESRLSRAAIVIVLLLVSFLPVVALSVAQRRRWLNDRVLAAACAPVCAVLIWLAWDEPAIRQPLPIAEFSPAFPGAEPSYAVLMRYSRQSTDPGAKAFGSLKLAPLPWGLATTREPEKWAAGVSSHRADIAANWAKLAAERAWAAELNAFPRLGDLTPQRLDADLIAFQVWRTLSQHTCAIATLQALDGQGDDAIATLLPMLELGRKLQPSSRTLVRSMIGVVVERMCLETAGLVLDRATVSPAARARLAAALVPDQAAALARRLILIEYANFSPFYLSMRLGDAVVSSEHRLAVARRPLNFVSGLFFNPNATINLYGRHVFDLAALAEARELGRFAVLSKSFDHSLTRRPGLKNVGGRFLVEMAMPSYEKVIESYWKTADLRAALRTRLAAPSV